MCGVNEELEAQLKTVKSRLEKLELAVWGPAGRTSINYPQEFFQTSFGVEDLKELKGQGK